MNMWGDSSFSLDHPDTKSVFGGIRISASTGLQVWAGMTVTGKV